VGPTRLIAGLALVAGGAVGFYGGLTPGASQPPARAGAASTAEAGSASEDPGTYTAEGQQSLDELLLEASEVGSGWIPTGYEPGDTPVCPLQALPALGTVLARSHAGFEELGGATVAATVLTRYEDPRDPLLVVDEVLSVSAGATDDGIVRGCATADGDEDGTVEWSDDSGTWSAHSWRDGDVVAMSMTSTGADGTVLHFELRWRTAGDLLVSVRAVSLDGPPSAVADRVLDAAVAKAS